MLRWEGSDRPNGNDPAFRRILGPFVLLLAVSLVACDEARRFGETEPRCQGVCLEVNNNHFLDVVVYARSDGGRARLGSVTGKSSADLEVPGRFVQPALGFRLEVDPVGAGTRYRTEMIHANPGELVVLEVSSVLRMSSWY